MTVKLRISERDYSNFRLEDIIVQNSQDPVVPSWHVCNDPPNPVDILAAYRQLGRDDKEAVAAFISVPVVTRERITNATIRRATEAVSGPSTSGTVGRGGHGRGRGGRGGGGYRNPDAIFSSQPSPFVADKSVLNASKKASKKDAISALKKNVVVVVDLKLPPTPKHQAVQW